MSIGTQKPLLVWLGIGYNKRSRADNCAVTGELGANLALRPNNHRVPGRFTR